MWITVVCGVALRSEAATINAVDGSLTAVTAAITAATDGDTVSIPAGSATWLTSLTINKAITLQGAGIGSTIIVDGLPNNANPPNLLTVNLVANKVTRITGIEFQPGTRTAVFTAGTLRLQGVNTDNRRVRVDHCKFSNLLGFAMEVNGALGVIDHNTVLFNQQVGLSYVRHSNFGGANYGDGSWAAADQFGTDQFIFFEDNTITCTIPGRHLTTVDGYAGSRYVFRHNTLTKGSLEVHGTESGGRNRGGRAFEIYNNSFVGDNSGQIVSYMRSGVGIIFSNSVSGYSAASAPLILLNERNENAYIPFSTGNAERAGADGKNPWDVNVPGGPFATGTAAATAASLDGGHTITLAINGTSWTPNQWRAYSITRTSGKVVTSLSRVGSLATAVCPSHGFSSGMVISIVGANQNNYNTSSGITVVDANTFTYQLDFGAAPASPATGTIIAFPGYTFSEVVSNTANTITYRAASQGPSYFLGFNAGDTFSLWQVSQAMDQPGRMGGSLVSGDTPSRPAGWNNQTTSPWYEWSNTREGGVPITLQAAHLTIRLNEHFFRNTVRPGYTPYVYPHPLVTGAGGPPPPPSGLHIVGGGG